eukprot:1157909-Pelagomonas_calceolata.AAC.5
MIWKCFGAGVRCGRVLLGLSAGRQHTAKGVCVEAAASFLLKWHMGASCEEARHEEALRSAAVRCTLHSTDDDDDDDDSVLWICESVRHLMHKGAEGCTHTTIQEGKYVGNRKSKQGLCRYTWVFMTPRG